MGFRHLLTGFALFCSLFIAIGKGQNPEFFDYSRGLRIDFVLSGSEVIPHAGLISVNEEPFWSAPARSNIPDVEYGEYLLRVYDKTRNVIFSRGFSSLYEEWLSTERAGVGAFAFEHSLSIPYINQPCEVALMVRQPSGWEEFARWNINPTDDFIRPYIPGHSSEVFLILGNKDNYKRNLDLAFVADGYTANQKEKAVADAQHFANFLINQPPFNDFASSINCWLVFSPSQQDGVTIPQQNIYRSTVVESSFNTLGLDRYLTTERYFKLRSMASAVPYDFVLDMVNTSEYGGGGIFNHFSVFSADGPARERVFLHEFGHHFGALADEYFDSEVPYASESEYLHEPWQPNVTTLVNFESKWASMVADSAPIPTPRIAKYKKVIGVFEGGLYVSKGVYSPAMDCRMKSNDADGFCLVCQSAIVRMLKMYID